VRQGDRERQRGPRTFRSLRHRDFRLLWTGTLFSGLGLWVQQTTLGWLAYALTGSGFMLGAVNGARSVPLLILGPFAGVAADRFDRRRLMLATQSINVLASAAFATGIVTGHLQLWHLFAMTMVSGVAWAFNMPVRQSTVPSLVPRADLLNAVALSAAAFNSSRIVGPTLAGLLIAAMGPGENFYLQAAAYLVVAFMVYQMRVPPLARKSGASVLANLREGAAFIWRHPTLRTQMLLALAPVVIGLPYVSLLPIFATVVLGVGPEGFGLLMAAPGVGAVLGTLTLASLNVERKGLVLLGAIFSLGVALVLFALSRWFPLSLLLLTLCGAFQMLYFTTNQTVIQLTAPEELRGRVLGVYMLNQGLLPLGSLFAGALADLATAPVAVAVMGTLVALLALTVGLRSPEMRRV
jgi:MFS transporter, DHA1 family, staphyloferrin A biosynthesis exporter